MKNALTANTAVKTKIEASRPRTSEAGQAKAEITRGMVVSLSAISGLIGAWTAACLIGGLVASGGPLSFLNSWSNAVIGI
ncbi:MAG: hypothetical protein ACLFV2_05260 [Desulfurivibrionaceae bacterium]